MNSLFSQPTQVEILNFQTFTNEYVANRYGISEATIRSHKKLHADELVENIHFITEVNKFGVNETKWTLRGIIKLGMFIRSPEAKKFRLWAEQELERSIQARIRKADDENIALTTTILDLSLELDSKDKHHNRQILGYKSQIAQHNAVIADLRKKLATLEKNNLELEPSAHNVVLELIYQFTMSKLELEEARKDLDKRIHYIDRFLSGLKNRYDKGWEYAQTLEQGGYN